MKPIFFTTETLQQTLRYWVDSAIETGIDDSLIELNEQFFETIQEDGQYGNFLEREKKNTYVGISKCESSLPDVIVEVSYHRRGREKTFKILDIYISPALAALGDKEYHIKYQENLIAMVKMLLDETDTLGSSTKIYARTLVTKAFIEKLHESASSAKDEFKAAGLDVRLEGERWLAFNRKNN